MTQTMHVYRAANCTASGGQAHLAAADAAQAAFLDEAMVLGRIDPLDEYRELWLELGLESGLPQAIGSGPGSGL